MRELSEIRTDIDAADRQLAELMEKRMSLSMEVAEYKKTKGMAVFDPIREQQVLESRGNMVKNQSLRQGITEIFQKIMDVSKEEQRKIMK